MRLRKFRVRAFRCIHDSGEIKVGDLAAFIGRNESGKTTILEALTLLNKDSKASELDLCDEMTDDLKSEVRLAERDFELNKKETSSIMLLNEQGHFSCERQEYLNNSNIIPLSKEVFKNDALVFDNLNLSVKIKKQIQEKRETQNNFLKIEKKEIYL